MPTLNHILEQSPLQFEEWRDVPGYESFYQVSNLGQILSLTSDRVLKSYCAKNKYRGLTLAKNGEHKHFHVHQLVMLAFVGPRPEGLQINHINGVKTDNRLDNLEYVTPSQNLFHTTRTLGKPFALRGENNPGAKLTSEIVRRIRDGNLTDISARKLAKQYGVSRQLIDQIRRGEKWKYIDQS